MRMVEICRICRNHPRNAPMITKNSRMPRMMPSSGFKRNTSLLAEVESDTVFAGTISGGSFILSIPVPFSASQVVEEGHKKNI